MFLRYLNEHKKGILFLLLCCGICAMIFAVYRIPAVSVIYAGCICAFFGTIFFVLDYRNFYRRHRQLEIIKRDLTITLDKLPETAGMIETDYQEMVAILDEDRKRFVEKMENSYREIVDYYTVWVHQIKSPITAMRLILQSSDFQERQELIDELNRIEQYVQMVLCYLRLNGDSSDYVIREYDLDGIIKPILRRNASLFIRKKLKLVYDPFMIRVVTDEKWLSFVIEQILSNALKYTSSGVISLLVEEPKVLCIKDTGIGIAPEDLPRVFEHGYTGENGRTDKKASGIGLYLCRQICENLGHTLSITSVPGQGTEVRIGLQNCEIEIE